MEKNTDDFENESYACCPECMNDYELQVIGVDHYGIEYLCACCYREFTVKKAVGENNV